MSYSSNAPIDELNFSTLKQNWGWTVAFGVLLSLAGGIALGSVTLTTISSVFVVGVAMVVSGVVEVAHGFAMRTWRHFFCGWRSACCISSPASELFKIRCSPPESLR